MWDVKGALTWSGDDIDEGSTDGASNTAGGSRNCEANSNTGCINNTKANTYADDLATTTTTATTDNNNNNNNSSSNSNTNNNNNNNNNGNFDTAAASSQDGGGSSARTSMEELEGGTGLALAGGKDRNYVGIEAEDDRGSAHSTCERGHSTLWPSEPSQSVSGEDYGDRLDASSRVKFWCGLSRVYLPPPQPPVLFVSYRLFFLTSGPSFPRADYVSRFFFSRIS